MSKFPAIPLPVPGSPESQYEAILALKESIELLTRQRGKPLTSAVTWEDLVALELIEPLQVPLK